MPSAASPWPAAWQKRWHASRRAAVAASTTPRRPPGIGSSRSPTADSTCRPHEVPHQADPHACVVPEASSGFVRPCQYGNGSVQALRKERPVIPRTLGPRWLRCVRTPAARPRMRQRRWSASVAMHPGFPHRSGLFCHARRIHHHKFHLHRPRRYRQPNEARSEPAHAVIAAIPPIPRSDSATARRPSTPAMRRNIPNHTHHASCAPSAHESIPTLAGTDRTAIPGGQQTPMQSPFHRFQSADLRNAPSAGDTFHMKHHVERILGERRRGAWLQSGQQTQ